MNPNDPGLKLVREFEGCAFVAYQDKGGVWTIGYGSIKNVFPGMTINQAEANRRLLEDWQEAQNFVNRFVSVPLNENQISALTSFTFNEGAGHLRDSTLLKLLNQNEIAAAADQFPRWMKVRGQTCTGLLRRRLAERQLFLTPLLC